MLQIHALPMDVGMSLWVASATYTNAQSPFFSSDNIRSRRSEGFHQKLHYRQRSLPLLTNGPGDLNCWRRSIKQFHITTVKTLMVCPFYVAVETWHCNMVTDHGLVL